MEASGAASSSPGIPLTCCVALASRFQKWRLGDNWANGQSLGQDAMLCLKTQPRAVTAVGDRVRKAESGGVGAEGDATQCHRRNETQ